MKEWVCEWVCICYIVMCMCERGRKAVHLWDSSFVRKCVWEREIMHVWENACVRKRECICERMHVWERVSVCVWERGGMNSSYKGAFATPWLNKWEQKISAQGGTQTIDHRPAKLLIINLPFGLQRCKGVGKNLPFCHLNKLNCKLDYKFFRQKEILFM